MLSNATLIRLHAACQAVAPVDGVCLLAAGQAVEAGWFVLGAPFGQVRVDGQFTAAQQTALRAAVSAFSITPTAEDELDPFGGVVNAAMLLKSSSQWSKMTAAQQTRIQAAIDAEAARIIAAVKL